MDYDRLDKYIQYVWAQAGEGYNTKSDIIDDLRDRGLTDEEIDYVIDKVWAQGEKAEANITKIGILLFCIGIILIILIITLLDTIDIIHLPPRPMIYLISFLIGSLILLFRKRHFK